MIGSGGDRTPELTMRLAIERANTGQSFAWAKLQTLLTVGMRMAFEKSLVCKCWCAVYFVSICSG